MSLNLQILISGQGSNCFEIIQSIESGELQNKATVTQVVSNRPEAPGLVAAQSKGIATAAIDHTLYSDRQDFEKELIQTIERKPVDYIILAGFMRKLSPFFVEHFKDIIINIHPSLLPLYPGLNTHQRALDAGDQFHGATVHRVTEVLDDGPLLGQAQLAVHMNDTPDTLKHRVQALEYKLYPKVIARLASGEIHQDIVRLEEENPS